MLVVGVDEKSSVSMIENNNGRSSSVKTQWVRS